MPDLSDTYALHPLPWRIYEGDRFGETLPLTIVDANNMPVCCIVGHGALDDRPNADDWRVARAILFALGE